MNENGLFNSVITSVKTYDYGTLGISLLAEHTTNAKSLKMSKACNTTCIISVSLNWLQSPKVRSYDLIGEYLDGTTVINEGKVVVQNGATSTSYIPDKTSLNEISSKFSSKDLQVSNPYVSARLTFTANNAVSGTYNFYVTGKTGSITNTAYLS